MNKYTLLDSRIDDVAIICSSVSSIIIMLKEKLNTFENKHSVSTKILMVERDLSILETKIKFLLNKDSETAGIKHIMELYKNSVAVQNGIGEIVNRLSNSSQIKLENQDDIHISFWGLQMLMEKCSSDIEQFIIEPHAIAA
jgi:uncharacterized protein YsxB (DUF464 family)